jgi:hypothetical protein
MKTFLILERKLTNFGGSWRPWTETKSSLKNTSINRWKINA